MPKPQINTDLSIGLVGLIAGCLILFVWIPLDVETGLTEKVRGQVVIGDAMAPSLAASILILGGLLTIFQSFRARDETNLYRHSFKFLVMLLVLLGMSMAVIRWAGPFTGYIFNADYRNLRDTVPWKYIGYFLGGVAMIFSLISMMEWRLRWRTFIISIIVVVLLIIVYDLPFENLLLPPNGDV